MEYAVVDLHSLSPVRMEITEEEFNQVRSSREMLSATLGIEEKFNILVENYAEYEMALLTQSLQESLSSSSEWSKAADSIHLMNRRLANLLATCRLYLDQVSHDLSRMLGKDAQVVRAITEERNRQYDERDGYLIMEALRNHAQHRSLPIHKISFKGSWVEVAEAERRRQRTVVLINTERLEDEGGLKKQALEKLKAMGMEVSLSPLVRDYVTGLMKVHQRLREELEAHLEKWDRNLKELEKRFWKHAGEEKRPLFIVAIREQHIEEKHSLFTKMIERRKDLERKNRGFGNLKNLFITS